MSDAQVLAEDLVFPEGPRWHEGKLWFSDIHDFKVKTCDLSGTVETVVAIPRPGRPSGLGFLPDGRLLIVSTPNRILVHGPDGLDLHADVSDVVAFSCNDMVVDAKGRAYIGTLGFDFLSPDAEPKPARLLLVTPDGKASIAAEGLGFPNGSVVTPDGRTLIVGETNQARFTAFDIEDDGTLSNRRVWAQFDDLGFVIGGPGGRIRPDGCCLDAEGAIWLASPGIDQVVRVRPGGEITHRLTASQTPYACMLGGPDRKTLFICSAKTHNIAEARASRSGRIETVQVETPGAGIP